MAVVSKRAVQTAGALIVLLAIIGAYRGFQQSAADADVSSTDGLLPVTNAVAARQASALAEPPPPVLTEAQIRTIARQEAQAALRPEPTSEPASTPSSPPSRPTPAPAASPAPAAAPAPAPAAEGANAPLF